MGTWEIGELVERPSILGGAAGQISTGHIDRLRSEIDAEARHLVAGVPPEALPLRLPKAKVTGLLACELYVAQGRSEQDGLSFAQAKGVAADQVVAAWCGGGRFTGTVEAADLLITSYGDPGLSAWWSTAADDERVGLVAELNKVADALADGLGPLRPEWAPRVQVGAAAVLAGGAVICEGRFDLELGGPPTPLHGAIVDVKTGSHNDAARVEHADDLLIYALLATFRDGWAPAWVGTWHATRASLDAHPVSVGSLEAAAQRLLLALERLAQLSGGRPPVATGCAQCQWCELRASCPSARPAANARQAS